LTTGVGGGGAVRQTGKYVLVFRRSGNEWQIVYDIHNNDTPAAPVKK
jgi:ketosteroid isomerase-like protein